MVRSVLFFTLFLSTAFLYAQVTDDFSDGNFTSTPSWIGSDTIFQVNGSGQLQLNATAAGTAYLSTTSSSLTGTEWNFWVRQNFAPSANNYGRIYLASDQADLSSTTLNGYYLQLGENGSLDAIELFRQNGASNTSVCRGTDGFIAASFNIRIKVTCDPSGNWEILADGSGGTAFSSQATGFDLPSISSTHMGWYCKYTVSNSTNFYLDDVYAGPPIIDTTPPSILSATAINQTSVDVLFSEPLQSVSANNASNYMLDNGIGVPIVAALDGSNSALVHLTVNSLTSATNYTITINNVIDVAGNVIVSNSTTTFLYFIPALPVWNDVVINEIMADPTPQVGLPDAEYVEIINRSSQPVDLSGWVLTDGSSNATFPSYLLNPGSYLFLCSTTNASLFTGNVLGLPSFPSINNTAEHIELRAPGAVVIDSVDFELSWYQDPIKEDGGWSLEKINYNLPSVCSGINNWIASLNTLGGSPGMANSVLNTTPDITTPQITTTGSPLPNQIQICFSEGISTASISSGDFILNNGIGAAGSIIWSTNNQCATLVFATALQTGISYTLTFPAIQDCSGNIQPGGTLPYNYFQAQAFDVVFNEVFPDPTPQVGLPDKEFVELYNRTNQSISLDGWVFSVGSNSYTLQGVVILPDSFLVLCAPGAVADYGTVAAAYGVSGLSTTALTNTGATLMLKDPSGILIHSLTYSDSWYNDGIKDDGGWTLEQMDPTNPCGGSLNWSASVNGNGGTPGMTNSILASNPDNIAPNLSGVRVLSPTSIEVSFSEGIVNGSALLTSHFSVNQSIGSSQSLSLLGEPVTGVILTFSNPLVASTLYMLTFSGLLSDCSANTSNGNLTTTFAIYEAQQWDVVFSELMPDPEPVVGLPASEYIELYNASGFPINLYNWHLRAGSSETVLPSYALASGAYVVLTAPSYANSFSQQTAVLSLPGLSSSALTNTDGILILSDSSGRVIHAVQYADAWYADPSKDDGGWSLEIIDPTNPCAGASNWRASLSSTGGTPGNINSVININKDLTSPNIISACAVTGSTVEVFFSEPIDSTTGVLQLTSYTINNGIGNPVSIQVQAPFYRSVVLNFATFFSSSVVYTLTVSNLLRDCAGNTMAIIEEAFILEAINPYEVVINEVMADPEPVIGLPATEYIELFNRKSVPVSTNGWTLKIGSTQIGLACRSIPAGGYLTLLPEGSEENQLVYGKAYAVEGFSGISNSSGTISLLDPFGKVVSTLSYTDDFYNNSSKAEGGWSMEQIDPDNPCGGSVNWTASTDPSGGTPGRINSVDGYLPDTANPYALRVGWVDSVTIVLHFSESMQIISLLEETNYLVDGTLSPILAVPREPDYRSVVLTFSTPFQKGKLYSLKALNVSDCGGMQVSSDAPFVYFGWPVAAKPGDLIINEVMFDPLDGGYDYAEVYQTSSEVLELSALRIANLDESGTQAENAEIITEESYLLLPGEYYAITENPSVVKRQYKTHNKYNFVEALDLPSLNVDMGSVCLTDAAGTLYDAFRYEASYHFPLLISTDGVALERIAHSRATMDRGNWTSASELSGFGTPGLENSQYNEAPTGTGSFVLSSEIFSPDNDGFQDVLQVQYKFDLPGYSLSVSVMDSRGRLVRDILRNEPVGTNGFFSWDGITRDNIKGEIGIYVLAIEYFDATGTIKHKKLPVVLATKL